MECVECEAYPYDDVDRGVSHPFSSARKGGGFVLCRNSFSPLRGCSFARSCYNQSAVAGEHSLNNKKGGLPPPPLSFAQHAMCAWCLNENMFSRSSIRRGKSLARISRIGIGGSAFSYVRVATVSDLMEAVIWYGAHRAEYKKNPLMVIGDATNVLFSDAPVSNFIIHNQASEIIPLSKDALWIGSGTQMNRVVDYCVTHARAGLSWAAGLPGTIGGAVYGNAGAFGGQMDQCIAGVVSLEKEGGVFVLRYRNAQACLFGYRTSIFKQRALRGAPMVIVAVVLNAFHTHAVADEQKAVRDHRRYRRTRHPVTARTLGSTFQNVPVEEIPVQIRAELADRIKQDPFPVVPAAVLLDRAGCKRLHVGGASFSAQHANFIVASGKTTARDVKKLCRQAHLRVQRRFGVALVLEIITQG